MRKIIIYFIFISSLFLLRPVASFAADLGFSPGSASYKVGDTISIDVVLTNNNQSINAVSGKISFSKDFLSISSISKDGSVIKYWTNEPAFSNGSGTINLEGIIPNPGFSGSRAKIITIRFIAKAKGSPRIFFTNGSVLANDGLATEVLGSFNDANLSITEKTDATPATVIQKPSNQQDNISNIPIYTTPTTSLTPLITSTTHPDQNAWYSNKQAIFNWNIIKEISSLKLSYDNNPEGIPVNVYTPAIISKTLNNLEDGSYYLHLQFKSGNTWGDISTYKFQIDTTPPDAFIPKISYTKDGVPELNFNSKDSGSGIDYYEISIDGKNPIIINVNESGVPYVLPKNTEGSHIVVVSAVDRAGNAVSVSIPVFFINKVAISSIWGDVRFLIVLILSIIAFSILTWFALVRFRLLKSKMGHDLESIVDTMKEDFVMLRENFDIHNSSAKKSKTTKEKIDIKKILKTSVNHLDLIERDIGHKIKTLKDKL